MLIDCTTKGCMLSSDAKLDKETNEVICEFCGNVIIGITPFMKKTLLGLGQVTKAKKKAFQTYCNKCNKNRALYMKDDKAYCEVCNTHIVVTANFLQGLKQYLSEQKKE